MSAAPDLDAAAIAYLAGEADAAAVARLSQALRGDAAARARFAELARLHGHLSEIGRRTAAGEVGTARLLAPDLPPDDLLPAASGRQRIRHWYAWSAAAAAGIILALSLLVLAMVGARTRAHIPTLAAVQGAATVQRDGGLIAAVSGLPLRAGDRLVVDRGGSLAIILTGGRCVLRDGAEAAVEAADEVHRRLVLVRGSIAADLACRIPIAVRTTAATIAVSDATATITVVESRTAVAVSRGSVEVFDADGGRSSIPAGGSWSGLAGASAARSSVVPALASKD